MSKETYIQVKRDPYQCELKCMSKETYIQVTKDPRQSVRATPQWVFCHFETECVWLKSKETHIRVNECQKRPIFKSKETYFRVNSNECQKRPTFKSKETHIRVFDIRRRTKDPNVLQPITSPVTFSNISAGRSLLPRFSEKRPTFICNRSLCTTANHISNNTFQHLCW